MDFHDFPRFLGNLGVEGDHPPKMCAGLGAGADAHAAAPPPGLGPELLRGPRRGPAGARGGLPGPHHGGHSFASQADGRRHEIPSKEVCQGLQKILGGVHIIYVRIEGCLSSIIP